MSSRSATIPDCQKKHVDNEVQWKPHDKQCKSKYCKIITLDKAKGRWLISKKLWDPSPTKDPDPPADGFGISGPKVPQENAICKRDMTSKDLQNTR